jgi:hypothetical protein
VVSATPVADSASGNGRQGEPHISSTGISDLNAIEVNYIGLATTNAASGLNNK